MFRSRSSSGHAHPLIKASRAQIRRMNDALHTLETKLIKQISPVSAVVAALLSHIGLKVFIHELNESVDKYFAESVYVLLYNMHKDMGYQLKDIAKVAEILKEPYIKAVLKGNTGLLAVAAHFAQCAHAEGEFFAEPNLRRLPLEGFAPLLEKYREKCLGTYDWWQTPLEAIPATIDGKLLVTVVYFTSIFILPPLIKKIVCDPLINRIYLKYKNRNTLFADPHILEAEVLAVTDAALKNSKLLDQSFLNNKALNAAAWLLLIFLFSYAIEEIIKSKNTFTSLSFWSSTITPFFVSLLTNVVSDVALPDINKVVKYFSPNAKALKKRANFIMAAIPESIGCQTLIEELATLNHCSIYLTISTKYKYIPRSTIATIIHDVFIKYNIAVTDVDKNKLTIKGDTWFSPSQVKRIKHEIDTLLQRYSDAQQLGYQLFCLHKALSATPIAKNERKSVGCFPEKEGDNKYSVTFYLDVPLHFQRIINPEILKEFFGLTAHVRNETTFEITGNTPVDPEKLSKLIEMIENYKKSLIAKPQEAMQKPSDVGKKIIETKASAAPVEKTTEKAKVNERISFGNGDVYDPNDPNCMIKPLEIYQGSGLPRGVYYVKLSLANDSPYYKTFYDHYTMYANRCWGKQGVRLKEEIITTDDNEQIRAKAKVKIKGARGKGDVRLYASSKKSVDKYGNPGREVLLDFKGLVTHSHSK